MCSQDPDRSEALPDTGRAEVPLGCKQPSWPWRGVPLGGTKSGIRDPGLPGRLSGTSHPESNHTVRCPGKENLADSVLGSMLSTSTVSPSNPMLLRAYSVEMKKPRSNQLKLKRKPIGSRNRKVQQ